MTPVYTFKGGIFISLSKQNVHKMDQIINNVPFYILKLELKLFIE